MEIGFGFNVWTLVSFISILVGLFYMYLNKKIQYWKDRGISCPDNSVWDVFVGMRNFKKKPMHTLILKNYRKCGRIYGIFQGFTPQLSVAEPHIVRNILVKDFNMFHNRIKFKIGIPIFDNMLSILADDDWKRIRCIMSPTFSSSRMRKMAYLVRECAEKFSKNLKKIADENENQSIDCKKYLGNFSLDVIASTAFGTKLNSLDDPDNEFVARARKVNNTDGSLYLLFFFIFPRLMKLLRINIFGKTFDYFKDFTLHVIQRREKEKFNANDFLHLLLEAQKGVLEISPEDSKEQEKEQSDFKLLPKHKTMTMDELISQCILFLFAGSETSTNTLALILYFMALNPECQEKLIEEIDQVWSNTEEMNFDVLSKMQYLDAVVCETLRKEPTGIQLVRECTEEYEINEIGFKIPKGMNVVIPVYAMHQDKDFFPNPEKFDPERFMPENRNSIPPYAYLPFGEGPRNCIGMRFAVMILKMCIVHFFRDIRVHATEETRKPLEFYTGQGLILPKKVMVKLERRN